MTLRFPSTFLLIIFLKGFYPKSEKHELGGLLEFRLIEKLLIYAFDSFETKVFCENLVTPKCPCVGGNLHSDKL